MTFPKLRFWFKEQTAPVALQSAIALMVGVISIYTSIPKSVLWPLGALTAFAIIWSWWGSAKAIQFSEFREETLAIVLSDITRILQIVPTAETVIAYEVDVNASFIKWLSSLEKILTAGQLHAVIYGSHHRVANGPFVNDTHRNMKNNLFHYKQKLEELAMGRV